VVDHSEHLFFEGVETGSRAGVAEPTRPARAARVQPDLEPSEHEPFLRRLLERAGLDASHYRPRALSRRMAACLRAVGTSDPEDALRLVDGNPALMRRAVDAVLLGVTAFFRDAPVFEKLERDVIPSLAALGQPLRVWSVGCSEGHELTSIAMLLEEAGRLEMAELLGTDCRPGAIERAALGCHGHADDICPVRFERFFSKKGLRYHLREEVRTRMSWKTADVLRGAEPGPWDLVLCRNVAIYLQPASADRVWQEIVDQIRPSGYLVVGKADHLPDVGGLQRLGLGVYRKVL
jgi:chemotaxis protein methyltransferase CheR